MMDLPTREEMLEALGRGVNACIFRARVLAEDEGDNPEDTGGLAAQLSFVEMALSSGAILVRMYEALAPEDEDEQDEARP